MKKLLLTIAIVLGLGFTSFAAPGGMFQRGMSMSGDPDGEQLETPGLPAHGMVFNQPLPLGNGIMVLAALGAAYLVGKRRKEE